MASRVAALTNTSTFLGKNLVALLDQSERWRKVIAIDDHPPAHAGARTEHRPIDLTQPAAGPELTELLKSEGVDTLVHLGIESPTHATAWAHEVEVIGTMRVVEACQAASIRKVVAASTTLLYGARPDNPNFLTEDHPLRAGGRSPFLGDKMEVEHLVRKLSGGSKKTIVTVLRTASLLGPTVRNYLTRYLSRRVAPMMLGYDPLWQFVHEADAVAAFELAIERDVPGVFNVVAGGVLPLSTIIKLAGRAAAPVPYVIARRVADALWAAQLIEAPAPFLDYLRYLCVADGARARRDLKFEPANTTRDALLDYVESRGTSEPPVAGEAAA